MLSKNPEHAALVARTKSDQQFQGWVLSVSPKNIQGQQPVFFEEAFLILKILWAIFQMLRDAGIFSRFLVKRQVRAALRLEGRDAQHATLLKIRDALLQERE